MNLPTRYMSWPVQDKHNEVPYCSGVDMVHGVEWRANRLPTCCTNLPSKNHSEEKFRVRKCLDRPQTLGHLSVRFLWDLTSKWPSVRAIDRQREGDRDEKITPHNNCHQVLFWPLGLVVATITIQLTGPLHQVTWVPSTLDDKQSSINNPQPTGLSCSFRVLDNEPLQWTSAFNHLYQISSKRLKPKGEV